MLILGLLGMYFDAAVVFVTKSSLLFRLAVAILCTEMGVAHTMRHFLSQLVQYQRFHANPLTSCFLQ